MPRTQRTRVRTRLKRTRNSSKGTRRATNGAESAPDSPQEVLEMIRNRRYIAFVRAIVGAARLRNSSR